MCSISSSSLIFSSLWGYPCFTYYHHTLPNEKSRAQAMGPRSVQQGELAEVQANIRLSARTEAGADIQLAWASKSRCTGRLVTKHLVFLSKGQDQCLHAFQPVECVCIYIYRLHIYISVHHFMLLMRMRYVIFLISHIHVCIHMPITT